MKKEKQEGSEEEVITFKEFVEKHKDIKEEELHKIVLKCANCGHKDLLKNFIRKKEGRWNVTKGDDTFPSPKPIEPYDDWNKKLHKPRWISKQRDTKRKMMAILENGEYEDMFFCKKCGSSLVVLCKEFIKNNMARLL